MPAASVNRTPEPGGRPEPVGVPEPGAPGTARDPAAVEDPPPAPPQSEPGRLASFYELTKPGIAVYVAMTAGVCYWVAARGRPDLLLLFHTALGTILATGGALALNQYVERDVDALMKRTRSRPLPAGRLAPREALTFGVALLLLGMGWLWGLVGWLPATLTAASAAAYLWVYTPLKSRSYLATLAGAVPGAFPALIGWTAATGAISLGGVILFGIAFLWQLPHVLALAWLLKDDYERVGFFMTPPSDPSGIRIGRHMVYHCISLLVLSAFPTLVGLTGPLYLVGAMLLGLAMLATGLAAAVDMSRHRARRV
ncbi:MAG TPA: heme o synthase, partial [Longimicrobiales bacterium]|nr:heme o synthase [Longimicrobiales bacterium]